LNILIITPSYEPENTAYTPLISSLCHDLEEWGNKLTIITPMPYNNNDAEYNKKIKGSCNENSNPIIVIRVDIKYQGEKGLYKRVINSLHFTYKSLVVGLKQKHIDIIFTCSTPPILGLIGVLLSFYKKKPLVFNLQDIFPDSLINAGIMNNLFLIKVGKLIESIIYKGSDAIVTIDDSFKYKLLEKNVPKEKIFVIPNWVDEELIKYVSRDKNHLFHKYNIDNNKFIVLYAGNMGLFQNVEIILKAAYKLKNFENILFVLIGDGADKDKLMNIKRQHQLRNTLFIPLQPQKYVHEVYSIGDVGIVSLKPNVSCNSIPSKTWNIMAVERPVIASMDIHSSLVDLLTKIKAGIGTDPNSCDDLKNAILYLYKNRQSIDYMGKNGRNYILKYLSRKDNTYKYYKLFQKYSCS